MRYWIVIIWLATGMSGRAFTLATYNVENYTLADRMVEGVHHEAYPKPESEKTALRRVILGMNADLLCLQEMGGPSFLAELQRDLRHDGLDYGYAVLLEAADPDRHVAVLSKYPLWDIRRHAAIPLRLFGRQDLVKRGLLSVTLRLPGGDLTVFVVHLKSRRTERPEDPEGAVQRQREAVAVRDLVLTQFPDPAHARFILCGDWNDTRASKAFRALSRRGQLEMGVVLPAVDSRGESWTHYYHKEHSYSSIDYILVSRPLLALVENSRATIHDGPGTRHASDHRPVLVRFDP
jgi:endonuclease/exonuclease/phosphatase family metal-dependent hydrolase